MPRLGLRPRRNKSSERGALSSPASPRGSPESPSRIVLAVAPSSRTPPGASRQGWERPLRRRRRHLGTAAAGLRAEYLTISRRWPPAPRPRRCGPLARLHRTFHVSRLQTRHRMQLLRRGARRRRLEVARRTMSMQKTTSQRNRRVCGPEASLALSFSTSSSSARAACLPASRVGRRGRRASRREHSAIVKVGMG